MGIETFNISKYNELLGRGLCNGVGEESGQVCIEAAVSLVLGEGLSDEPTCVASAVRHYAIVLNDSGWSSPRARAAGLRDLGLAQLGSAGVVDNVAFARRLVELHIRELLPAILREVFPGYADIEAAAKRCEEEGSADAARYAAAGVAAARYAARYAGADAARYAGDAAAAAVAAARYAGAAADRYLLLSAAIAVRVLREMGSPGVRLIGGVK